MAISTIFLTSDGQYFSQQEDADNYILANPGTVYWEVYYDDTQTPVPKSFPISDPSGNVKLVEVDSEGNVGTDTVPPNPFGTFLHRDQSSYNPPLQTTNSWVTASTVTLSSNLPAGSELRVGFSVVVRLNKTTRDVDVSIRRNGSQFILPVDVQRVREEMKDKGSDQRVVRSGQFYTTSLQANDTLELVVRGTSGATARVYYGLLEVWRVK